MEAQVAGWGPAIAILSVELGKEFVVGIIERIRDDELTEEDVARIVQEELDRSLDLPDLRRLLEQIQLLPETLERILNLNNVSLMESLQADLAAYPTLISAQTADAVQRALLPRIQLLSREVSALNERSERILTILESLIATPSFAIETSTEIPLKVFVSSIVPGLSAERQVLRQAITGLGITKSWIFESTPASTQLLETSYLDQIRHCDLFILVLDDNTSPVQEQELETALEYDRPVLAFRKKDKSNG